MAIISLPRKLTARNVREAPEAQGVFTLWDGDERIYIGYTPGNRSLRDSLREHFALAERGVIAATHYSWETSAIGKTRQAEILAACLERNGRLPRYNREGSPLETLARSATDLRARR
ncbi:MAG TPA: hypothetical protein VM489_04885 [Burkholderiales bacterium]|nr:hypothetical protein [Burkholderiales bacterium]